MELVSSNKKRTTNGIGDLCWVLEGISECLWGVFYEGTTTQLWNCFRARKSFKYLRKCLWLSAFAQTDNYFLPPSSRKRKIQVVEAGSGQTGSNFGAKGQNATITKVS